ncbi:PAS domain-containing sensor histidine kinase [Stenomitos frigidus]|nr:PAS domain S-box protein [Stenomitos frigidus]
MHNSAAISIPSHQLQATSSKMAFALNWVDESIAWTDECGRMQWCNSAFEQLVHQPAADMAERLLTELMPLTLEGEPLPLSLHPVYGALTTNQQQNGAYGFQAHDRSLMLAVTVVPLPGMEDNHTANGVMLVVRASTTQRLSPRSQQNVSLEEKVTVNDHTAAPSEPSQWTTAQFEQINQQLRNEIAEHKQTEAALRKSKERFCCIFDNAPIAISLADAHTYHIVETNYAHRALLGYSSDELAKMTHVDITHPDDVGNNLEQIKQLLDGAIPQFQIEKRFVKKNGDWIWATLTVSIIRDPDGRTYSLGMIEDITDRKQAEEALLENQQLLQLVIDSVPTAIFWKDRALRYLGCNHRFAIDAGLATPKDIIGKDDFELPWAIYAERSQVEDRQVITSKQPKLGREGLLLRARGEQCWIKTSKVPLYDNRGAVVGVLGTYEDITKRRQAEKSLRLTQFSIDRATDPMWWVKPDGSIYYVNDAACRDLGDNRESIIGKQVSDFSPDLTAAEWDAYWLRIKAEGSSTFETLLQAKDGSIFPIEVTANYIKLNDQEYQCSFVRNITDRKQTEDQLRSSLKEKEVLLKEVHHRVKNNLQMVYSLLNLQANAISDPNILAPFRDSQHRIKAMALLHEKLYQSESLAKIDFSDYVHNLVTDLLHSYSAKPAKISLKLEIAERELAVDVVIPCGFMINELVTNALKYAFPGDRTGEIQICFFSLANNQCLLVIADNGIGMPTSIAWSHTNSLPALNSLGLQLVHAFAHQLRGTLTLDRTHGSRFELLFPTQGRSNER